MERVQLRLTGQMHKMVLQLPKFGAFYPPAQDESSPPEGKKRRRRMQVEGRRAVLPRLPCPRSKHDSSASWDAPELEDIDEQNGSNIVSFGVPAILALQQDEQPASAPPALTDQPPAAESKRTQHLQLPSLNWQADNASSQTASQQATAPQQKPLFQASMQSLSTSLLLDAQAKDSTQSQAAAKHVTFGQPQIPGDTAAPAGNQLGQDQPHHTAKNVSTAGAAGGTGMPTQSTFMPFQPAQPTANPGQQSGLTFGQPFQQVSSRAVLQASDMYHSLQNVRRI